MDQTHIGYTYWQEPPVDTMPSMTEVLPRESAGMGIYVEGSTPTFSVARASGVRCVHAAAALHRHFYHGRLPFDYTATATEPWIQLSSTSGHVGAEGERLWVSIDWNKIAQGMSEERLRSRARVSLVR